jgi:DNA polymerase-3 subunit epsilon
VHGLSEKFLAGKSLFRAEVDALLAFLGDSKLVAHNARFDFGFLNAELGLCGRDAIDLARMVDTVTMARSAFPGAKHSLDALCVRYGIDRSHRVKHGALLDAELLAQVYIELTGGRQIGLGLVAQPSDEPAGHSLELVGGPTLKPARAPRHFAPSPAERERHDAFVAKLDAPLWRDGPDNAGTH